MTFQRLTLLLAKRLIVDNNLKTFQVRQLRANIERNVYQTFLLQNIEFISETLENLNSTNQNQGLQNDFKSIVWFMISKFPTKIITSKVLFEPLKKHPVELLTMLDKLGFPMPHKLRHIIFYTYCVTTDTISQTKH